MAGIRGYEGKIERRKKEGKPLYRTAKESGETRRRKKLVGKTSWFRDRKKEGNTEKREKGKNKSPGGNIKGEDLKTRTVIYVEFTPRGGTLKKNEGALDETGGEPGI